MAAAGQFALDTLEVVEFAVDDNVQPLVLVGDRLIAGHQINNAQPGVPQGYATVRRHPMARPSGPRWCSVWVARFKASTETGPLRENMATMPHMSA